MIIGIDINPANREQRTGTEWYAYNLVQEMKKLPLLEGEEFILYSKEPLKGTLAELPKGWSSQVLNWPFKRLWTQGRLTWEMFRRPPNVLFVPAHAVPRLHPHKKKKNQATVTTVHDVGFKRYGRLYNPKERRYLESTTKFTVKHCAKILTPSDFTKQELIKLYKAPAEKIVVTPLAPDPNRFQNVSAEEINRVRRKYRLTSSTFLTVSRMEAKKNIITLVRAFEFFKSRRGIGDPFQLVLAGKPGTGYQNINAVIQNSPVKNSIKELGWVSDEDIAPLTSGAFSYVYPSWYEGLGISALEAMASGAALICSSIPALYEAAGDAALYFAPNEPDQLAGLMTQLVEEGATRESLIIKGKERAAGMLWKTTAEITLGVLRQSVSVRKQPVMSLES